MRAICLPASRCSPHMVTSQRACWRYWHCSQHAAPTLLIVLVASNLVGAINLILDYYRATPADLNARAGELGDM